ncbi:sel1 repeat family protein [uncultured Neisseria sp.]|uniref:sel1 repeat family protein n=1 Tax=uncultured Neisseria sp. TaxID=237778 RepID=UPI0025D67EEA|nr:sel1 repeat family protein [uncultured Neisseria sp.]
MNVRDLIKEGVALFKNKKFDEAIEKLNQALDGIEDKDSQIQVQNSIHFWLGRCYFEQAMQAEGEDSEHLFGLAVKHFQQQLRLAKQLEGENGIQKQINAQSWLGRCYFEQAMQAEGESSEWLFDSAIKHQKERLRLAKQLEGENGIQKQNNAQYWLGRCYLEQARKAKGKESEQLFGLAVEHFQQQLRLAEQLEDKQNCLQEQIYAQSWLGRCYFEQAMQAEGENSERLFESAVKHQKQRLRLAKQLEGENSIQKQINAQYWLGRCYLEQARKAKGKESEQLFGLAVEHFQQQLRLAEQLEDKQNCLQEQIYAQSWLGRCYFEQAMQAEGENSERLFESAVKHQKQRLRLAKQLEGENSIQKQINAQYWLGRCYFEQAVKSEGQDLDSQQIEENNSLSIKVSFSQEKWKRYFDWKVKKIQNDLFEPNGKRTSNVISTILAVLHITPIELGELPLSHYTSPFVCEKLFGIGNYEEASPMRIGSSTYMNDPTEGEGLMELLNLQDLELENKADCPVYNAFFTCFSSRINDLNQFRLYGKENSVEASGCCLVFNKKVRWLKGSNVLESFRRLTDKSDEAPETSAEVSDLLAVNLPLYQVAYIAYKDEYIAEEKCRIWLPNKDNPKFGIRLKSFGNKGWHECRIGKLEEALKQLIKIFKGKANISDKDKKALEYIRYLFKDFAFRDEEEFRLLKIEQIGSKDIKYCQDTKSVYLPYADIRNIVDEVILGTNYEKSGKERKAEVFQHLMRKHYPNVKVSRSSLPINANPPIKKD